MNRQPGQADLPLLMMEAAKENGRCADGAAEPANYDTGELLRVPEPPPVENIRHHKFGRASHLWIYRREDGSTAFAVVRFDRGNGGKVIVPYTYVAVSPGRIGGGEPIGSAGWHFRGPIGPRTLYNLDLLARAPEAKVVVCEGEKSCSAAARIFPGAVCVTSMGGSEAAAKSDWTPLRGRRVTIWPDNDEPGRRYARVVAGLAKRAGALSIGIVDIPAEWPAKWDLADDLPAHVSSEYRDILLQEAQSLDEWLIKAHNLDAAITLDGASKRASKKDADLWSAVPKVANDGTAHDPSGERAAAGRNRRLTDVLLDIAEAAELFHTSEHAGFADLLIDGHRETWPISSAEFRRWLVREFYLATGTAPGRESLTSAIDTIEARAQFDSPERAVFLRVGSAEGRHYLDLCDSRWRAVEIDRDRWRIVNEPPVRFRRTRGMQPLPAPEAGGSIHALRPFLNVRSDHQFVLVVAWVLAALRDRGPFPLLVLSGEQGSAKSTFSRLLRDLIDPNTSLLRAPPGDIRDLYASASNGHVIAFDNISGLTDWISDGLCRLATGGGYAARKLYTDQEEIIMEATRPVMLNGIEAIATRADLVDRAIIMALEPISESQRRSEAELRSAFEMERPRILGALMDAMVHGLRQLPGVRLPTLPRMADFAIWATACETAFTGPKSFWSAYSGNINEAGEEVLDGDPVVGGLQALLDADGTIKGTATELLARLCESVGERTARSKAWPQSSKALSGKLRRLAPILRKSGVSIEFDRAGHARTRIMRITRHHQVLPNEMAINASAASAVENKQSAFNDLTTSTARTLPTPEDAELEDRTDSVRSNPLIPKVADDADANSGRSAEAEAPGPTNWCIRV